MVKINLNRTRETKLQIPSFSLTLSQIFITIAVLGLAISSLLVYINANYLIELGNNALAALFNIFEQILMWLGIGSILITLWIILSISTLNSAILKNVVRSHKKEFISLLIITFFIWGLCGIMWTSNGFPGWSSNSSAIPLGGIIGKSISGYAYGLAHAILRLSGILLISALIAKPNLFSLLLKSITPIFPFFYKMILAVYKSINNIYSLKPSPKAIESPTTTLDNDELNDFTDSNDDISENEPTESPGNFIQNASSIEKTPDEDLFDEHQINPHTDFVNTRPNVIENNGALFNEFWGTPLSTNIENHSTRKSPQKKAKSADWKIPTLEILENSEEITITVEEIEKTSDIIKKTFASYRIEVDVAQVRPGPTVTMYGIEPGWVRKTKRVQLKNLDGSAKLDSSGKPITEQQEDKTRISVDNILRREKDLSLALKTPSLRIETPVMGESLLGIEVPNPTASLVSLRKVMQSDTFKKLKQNSALPVALGRGSDGDEVVFDLAKMPHLLIAGATGSGKSVCMNAIISCLTMNHSPAELQMLLVDPKRVELTPYNGIPHLITPVVVETDKVVSLLKGLIQEMMDRYRTMEEIGVRNIETYNKKSPHTKMPYIVVGIDELADLMMTAAFDVEQSICRLAQLGRATGIHLIIATQRPSVDVITGLIKANFPSRISFAVTSQVDSRTILDTVGADKLLGKGDMLYQPIDMGRPTRVQSVYISDNEISKIVNYWENTSWGSKSSIDLSYNSESSDQIMDQSNLSNDKDSLLEKALDLAQSHNKLSTSLLQRRLRIGYPRAARLMDDLEDMGIVGPSDGSKSRDVIIQSN